MKRKKTKNLFKILFVPMMFLLIMWTTHLFQFVFNISFIKLGVLPKTYIGLKGIFLSPFIHKDWSHLINNSYPILVLGTLLFYSYKKNCLPNFLFTIYFFWCFVVDDWAPIVSYWSKWHNIFSCILSFF